MPVRLVPVGAALALLAALTGAVVACYDIPRPACGFLCGPDGQCPGGYTCAGDGVCHRIGAPDSLTCASPDARLPIDAAPDTRDTRDARDAPDAADAALGATQSPAREAVPGAAEAAGEASQAPLR